MLNLGIERTEPVPGPSSIPLLVLVNPRKISPLPTAAPRGDESPRPRHYFRRFPCTSTPGSLYWIEPLLITSRHPSFPLTCDLAS
jgi:hypothetical protein